MGSKPTLYAILTHRVRPKARESTQMKLHSGKQLHADDMLYSSEQVSVVGMWYKGEGARSQLEMMANELAADLRLTDTNTIVEVQETWDARSDYNQFVVRQVHRRNGEWQCSTFFRMIELGMRPAAEWIELGELRELKGLVDG